MERESECMLCGVVLGSGVREEDAVGIFDHVSFFVRLKPSYFPFFSLHWFIGVVNPRHAG